MAHAAAGAPLVASRQYAPGISLLCYHVGSGSRLSPTSGEARNWLTAPVARFAAMEQAGG